MTVPTFQLPIAGQADRHYDRFGPLEWKWRSAIWVLFKDRCAIAWLVPSDKPPDQWRVRIIDTHLPFAASIDDKQFADIEEAKACVEAWTVREGLTPCQ